MAAAVGVGPARRGVTDPPQGLHLTAIATVGFVLLVTLAPVFLLRRILFIFYTTQLTPLIATVLAGVLILLWRHRHGPQRFAALLLVSLVAGAFVLYYPLVTGTPTEPGRIEWLLRIVPWTRDVLSPGG